MKKHSVRQKKSSAAVTGTSYLHVPYAAVSESDYLNLYVPKSEKPLPLLILVHGGGFVMCDCEARLEQYMYRYFRHHGYAVATVNYRLAAEAPFPAALQDTKAAIRFLRAHAGDYGCDPDRFAIYGESSGGWQAIMAAVTNDAEFNSLPFIGEEAYKEPVSASVSAVLDFYGIIDFVFDKPDFKAQGFPVWMHTLFTNGIGNFHGYKSAPQYWMRKNWEDFTPEDIDESSARYYIEENWDKVKDLAVMICHGTADITVSPRQSQRLFAALVSGRYTRDGSFLLDPDTPAGKDPGKFLSLQRQGGRVVLDFREKYWHADKRFYSQEYLREVQAFLDRVLKGA